MHNVRIGQLHGRFAAKFLRLGNQYAEPGLKFEGEFAGGH